MELRHLRYFVAIADTGTVSRAAGRVHISQPALSRQIHDLEAELGVALFERAGRNLRLTGAGEDLLVHSRNVLHEADALRERARALQGGDAGILRVGATPQTLQRLFPPVLARFRARSPSIDVRLTEGHPAGLLDLIRQGELHLAFTTYQPELRSACRLAGTAPLLAVSDGGRTLRRTVEVRALEDVPLLLLQRGFGTRDLFEAACHVAHIRPAIFLESSAPATLLSLVRAGCGVAILPATVALPRTGFAVHKLLQDGKPLLARLAVHWNPLRHLPHYAERFAEDLAAESRTMHGSPARRRSDRHGR
jgi:DNA-binding transcriptional LysR family regulator